MIGTIDVKINSANPNIPLKTLFAFVNSPSSIRVIDVPKKIGKWNITEVFITANYPDNTIVTSQCVLVGGCWTATIVGSTVTGKSLNGFTISANGIDENGSPIDGYVLGKGAIEILDADTKLAPTDPIYYIHVLNTKPEDPTKGDAYVDGGVWYFYNGENWVTLGGTYAGNGWAQYPESEGGDGKWHRLVISDGKISYEEDGVDEPESDPFALKSDLDAEVDRSTQAEYTLQDEINSLSTSVNTRITEEISRATGVEEILSGDLNDEIERAVGKENEISSKLDNAISAYQAKDTELQKSIEDEVHRATDAEQTNAQAISDEETARISSDEELEGKISDEETRAKTAEGVLSSRLDADEILINTNAQDIATEVLRAKGAESFLSGKIDDINSELEGVATKSELSDESEARNAADADLQTQINTISSDYLKSEDKTELEGKITAEETRSEDVENTLSAAINTKADDNAVVKLTGNQAISGIKSFGSAIIVGSSALKRTSANSYAYFHGGTSVRDGATITLAGSLYEGAALPVGGFMLAATDGKSETGEGEFSTTSNISLSPNGYLKLMGSGPDIDPRVFGPQFAMAGMPSTTLVELTLPESGGFVQFSSGVDIAPWSGWITITKETTNNGQYLLANVYAKDNTNLILNGYSETTLAGRYVRVSVPIAKGQRCYIYYNAGGQNIMCRFSKAEAEVSK